MKGKNLKKPLSIIGIVAVGLYLVFYIITTSISTFSSAHITGLSILSYIWSLFRAFLLHGYICFYFVYELIKKSDKHDKILNIFLFVVFCILAVSSIVGIISSISRLSKYIDYLSGIRICSYIIDIVNYIIKIGVFVLFGINIMGLVINKNKASKILTFIIWGLLALIFVNSIISIVLTLIGYINVKLIFTALGAIITCFSLSVFEACLAYIIFDKIKEQKKV